MMMNDDSKFIFDSVPNTYKIFECYSENSLF